MMGGAASLYTMDDTLRRAKDNTNNPLGLGDHVSLLDGGQDIPRPRVRSVRNGHGHAAGERRAV